MTTTLCNTFIYHWHVPTFNTSVIGQSTSLKKAGPKKRQPILPSIGPSAGIHIFCRILWEVQEFITRILAIRWKLQPKNLHGDNTQGIYILFNKHALSVPTKNQQSLVEILKLCGWCCQVLAFMKIMWLLYLTSGGANKSDFVIEALEMAWTCLPLFGVDHINSHLTWFLNSLNMSQRHSYKLWLRDAQGICYIMDFTHLPGTFASSASAPSMAGDESPPPHDNQWSRGPCSCPGKTTSRAIFWKKNRFSQGPCLSIESGMKKNRVSISITPSAWSGSIDPSFSGTRWNPSLQTWRNLFAFLAGIFQSQLEQRVVPNLHRNQKFTGISGSIFFVPKVDFNPSPLVNLFLRLQGHHRRHQHLASMTYQWYVPLHC